jgi:VanZ family protein
MGKLINRFRPYARILLAIWVVLVIVLAIIPDLPVPRIGGKPIPLRLDSPVHFLEHFLLAFLAMISFVNGQEQKRRIYLVLYALIIFALIVEIIQVFLPFRSFELKDLGLNIAGILTGTITALLSIGGKKH